MGPQRADLLKKELGLFTFRDLLEYFPFRHVDRTRVTPISEIHAAMDYVQVAGVIRSIEIIGDRRSRRMTAQLQDRTGSLELAWFQGISWIQKSVSEGQSYLVFGRVSFYKGQAQIIHPELEVLTSGNPGGKNFLEPVYPSTEKLTARGLGGRQLGKLTFQLISQLKEGDIPENLPDGIIRKLKLADRYTAYRQIHFPASADDFEKASARLKFEELFLAQLRLGLIRARRHRQAGGGVVFKEVGSLFNTFYTKHLPFELTGAQKRVIREIRNDTARGYQMNRLLQGDVGSGKTIVALLVMLIALDNDYQACLMAPTEILAQQHFRHLSDLVSELPIRIDLLTGSVKSAERKKILSRLLSGETNILVGTHAVIEETVQFKNLGLAIIDEQHRFGVAQRAKLWEKSAVAPHVLVMTATPIPRTLAMTAYGDLDYSVINELPAGRQPIVTTHRYDSHRARVMDFLKSEIGKGRQVYIIFPLIEESEKLDYENLMKGYENVKAYFPEPRYWISMLHGRQTIQQKQANMQRFVSGDTQIMVSTTVVEVGVNVPNATVMVIESAEKFGLSQLHQLRGRVGRGSEKSYCILMTGPGIGKDARERIRVMTSTTDGFEIAEKDLRLRGPGDIEGTKQSGALNFKLASIVQDRSLLELAHHLSDEIIENDPELLSADNLRIREYLLSRQGQTVWSQIS